MGKEIFGALDLGSSKIKAIVVREDKESFELIEKIEKDSEGIKRGKVVEPEKLAKVLKWITREMTKVPPFFVNLSGEYLSAVSSKGIINISRADQIVSEEDIKRALKSAEAQKFSFHKEVLDIIPQYYVLDNEIKTENPLGMKGFKMELQALLILGIKPYFENLQKSLKMANVEVLDFIPNPIALSFSVLKEKEKEKGVCVLNIGAELIEVSIFKDGFLKNFFVLPLGSEIITNKLALFLKKDFEIAERIKIEFGSCFSKEKKKKLVLEEGKYFSQGAISKKIRESLSKIFDEVKKELKKNSEEKEFPGGFVLCGGGAKIKGIEEIAKQKFQHFCRVKKPKKILGLDEDPSFCVCEGLILAGLNKEKEKGEGEGMFFKIINFFKGFIP
jgi:cell division protein FtsA